MLLFVSWIKHRFFCNIFNKLQSEHNTTGTLHRQRRNAIITYSPNDKRNSFIQRSNQWVNCFQNIPFFPTPFLLKRSRKSVTAGSQRKLVISVITGTGKPWKGNQPWETLKHTQPVQVTQRLARNRKPSDGLQTHKRTHTHSHTHTHCLKVALLPGTRSQPTTVKAAEEITR